MIRFGDLRLARGGRPGLHLPQCPSASRRDRRGCARRDETGEVVVSLRYPPVVGEVCPRGGLRAHPSRLFRAVLSERDLPAPCVAYGHARAAGALCGVIFTASHNPPEYNGVKLYTQTASPAPRELLDAIEAAVDRRAEDFTDFFVPQRQPSHDAPRSPRATWTASTATSTGTRFAAAAWWWRSTHCSARHGSSSIACFSPMAFRPTSSIPPRIPTSAATRPSARRRTWPAFASWCAAPAHSLGWRPTVMPTASASSTVRAGPSRPTSRLPLPIDYLSAAGGSPAGSDAPIGTTQPRRSERTRGRARGGRDRGRLSQLLAPLSSPPGGDRGRGVGRPWSSAPPAGARWHLRRPAGRRDGGGRAVHHGRAVEAPVRPLWRAAFAARPVALERALEGGVGRPVGRRLSPIRRPPGGAGGPPGRRAPRGRGWGLGASPSRLDTEPKLRVYAEGTSSRQLHALVRAARRLIREAKKGVEMFEIETIMGREVLDSRGNPTVEAEVVLAGGAVGSPSFLRVPRPGVARRWSCATGTRNAIAARESAAPSSTSTARSPTGSREWMRATRAASTPRCWRSTARADKSRLGANAILSVSLAVARAAAEQTGLPLYRYLGGTGAHVLPVPCMNLVNGGAHADNSLDIQEFMAVPWGFDSFSEALRAGVEVFHALRDRLRSAKHVTAVGDEGGFAPNLPNNGRRWSSWWRQSRMPATSRASRSRSRSMRRAASCAPARATFSPGRGLTVSRAGSHRPYGSG